MIEVPCICGKVYQVPPERAGKRLQCRRCGNVQRIPGGPGASTRRGPSGSSRSRGRGPGESNRGRGPGDSGRGDGLTEAYAWRSPGQRAARRSSGSSHQRPAPPPPQAGLELDLVPGVGANARDTSFRPNPGDSSRSGRSAHDGQDGQDGQDGRGGPGGSGRGRAGGQRVRRCPVCGTQDDASVVLCVRCGYDWRTGRQVPLTTSSDPSGERFLGTQFPEPAELEQLTRLAWLSLSPLGLVIGPYVFWQLRQAGGSMAGAGRHLRADELGSLAWLGLGGALGWAALALVVVIALGGSDQGREADRVCRARLTHLGALLEARLQERPLVPKADAWLRLVEAAGERDVATAGPASDCLRCAKRPESQPFGLADSVPLTPNTEPDYLVAWDPVPHPDPKQDGIPVYRGLRRDGQIEVFPSAGELERARARPAFRRDARPAEADPPSDEPGPGPVEPDEEILPPAKLDLSPAELQQRFDRLVAKALELGSRRARDPAGFRRLSGREFEELVGSPAGPLLALAVQPQRPDDVRAAAIRWVGLIQGERLGPVLAQSQDDPAPRVVWARAENARHAGRGEWVGLAARVAGSALQELAERAQRALNEEMTRSPEALARVLNEASKVRSQLGLTPTQTVVGAPPPAALGWTASLLGDPLVGEEALISLRAAGEPGRQALIQLLGDPGRNRDFGVWQRGLRLLVEAVEDRQLEPLAYLELVAKIPSEALGGELQLDAVDLLLERYERGLEAPEVPPEVIEWAVGVLRGRQIEQPAQRLRAACLKLLPFLSAESLAAELTQAGQGSNELLGELGSARRQLDPALDAALEQEFPRIPAALRPHVLARVKERIHPGTPLVLLAALESERDPALKIQALKALKGTLAEFPRRARTAVRKYLIKEIKDEADVKLANELVDLVLRRPELCSKKVDKQDCDSKLLAVLIKRGMGGLYRAFKALQRQGCRSTQSKLLSALGKAANKGDQTLEGEIQGALRSVTGVQSLMLGSDVERWRQAISDQGDRVRATREALFQERQAELKEIAKRREARRVWLKDRAAHGR